MAGIHHLAIYTRINRIVTRSLNVVTDLGGKQTNVVR